MHTVQTPFDGYSYYGLGRHDFRPHAHTQTPCGINGFFNSIPSDSPSSPDAYQPWQRLPSSLGRDSLSPMESEKSGENRGAAGLLRGSGRVAPWKSVNIGMRSLECHVQPADSDSEGAMNDLNA